MSDLNLDPKLILSTAMECHLGNKFQVAHDCYAYLINSNPSNAHARHLLGVLYIQNGMVDEGKRLINEAVLIDPQCKEAIQNLSSFDNVVSAKIKQEETQIDKSLSYPRFTNGKVEDWNRARMLDFAPIFSSLNAKWLTIGDINGHDSISLKKAGINDVVASNLDTHYLELGNRLGEVGEYIEVNAENIALDDKSFDYVLCKEALHHMPRPALAIYEMLRVARKGIFFIEPQDQLIDYFYPSRDVTHNRELIDDENYGSRVSYKDKDGGELISRYVDWWEEGAFNYVYSLSKREIKKIALGMGLPAYSTKCFNDYYNAEWAGQPANESSEGFKNTKQQIELLDQVCRAIGAPSAYITGMLFKEPPSAQVVNELRSIGYDYNITPTRYLPIKWPVFN